MSYVYKRHFVETQYGVRKDGDMFMMADSSILVNAGGDITVKEREFNLLKGLWELLTRKKVNTDFITKDDLNMYKEILTMNNAHLTRYHPNGNINITCGKNFVITMRSFLRNQ